MKLTDWMLLPTDLAAGALMWGAAVAYAGPRWAGLVVADWWSARRARS